MQVLGQFFIPNSYIAGQAGNAFFLYGSVEPLQMSVVVRGFHPAVTVGDTFLSQLLSESFGELRSVVALNRLKIKKGNRRSSPYKPRTRAGADPCDCFSIIPARIDIE